MPRTSPVSRRTVIAAVLAAAPISMASATGAGAAVPERAAGSLLTAQAVPSSLATHYTNLGRRCEGFRAVRCAWINTDSKRHRIRGWGSVSDKTDGKDAVAVRAVLQGRVKINGKLRWRNVATSGVKWGTNTAVVGTGLAPCVKNRVYRTVVSWTWHDKNRKGVIVQKARGTVTSKSVALILGRC